MITDHRGSDQIKDARMSQSIHTLQQIDLQNVQLHDLPPNSKMGGCAGLLSFFGILFTPRLPFCTWIIVCSPFRIESDGHPVSDELQTFVGVLSCGKELYFE
jgi:hypothetical protein